MNAVFPPSNLTRQGVSVYTPGDALNPVRGLPQNPPVQALGMTAPASGALPVVGLFLVVGVLLLLERRRLKRGGRK